MSIIKLNSETFVKVPAGLLQAEIGRVQVACEEFPERGDWLTMSMNMLLDVTECWVRAADKGAMLIHSTIGSYHAGGSGGGGGLTDAQLRASNVPVRDTEQLTILSEMQQDIGRASMGAWSGTGSCTIMEVLKALHAQNAMMISQLSAIDQNTKKA